MKGDLSLREIGILRLLHENAGRVVHRDTFFNRLWGLDHVPNSRTLDQQIAKLRKRVEADPAAPRLISRCTAAGIASMGDDSVTTPAAARGTTRQSAEYRR